MSLMSIAEIRRHPVKGFGAEIMSEAELVPGRALVGDRIYALASARGAEAAQEAAGAWVSCRNFVRPTTDPRMAQVTIVYDAEKEWLIAKHPDLAKMVVDLGAPTGGPALCDWAAPLTAEASRPLTLIAADPVRRGAAAHYADDEAPAISIMTLASLAALSEAAGVPEGATLDPARLRGNVWLRGGAAWDEDRWIGKKLRLGAATLEVIAPIERCSSPEANPATGRRDVSVTRLLHGLKREMTFGVLARVVEGGRIAPRDLAGVIED